MSLNEVASAARSSAPPTTIRSSSLPADSRCAARAACRTGSTTHRVTSEAIAASSATSAIPTPMSVVWTSCRVCCSSVSGNTKYSW